MAVRLTWYGLSEKQRRQVWRLARKGKRHPDAAVADAAERWAHETLQKGVAPEVFGSTILGVLIGGAFGGGWFGAAIGERRVAKRIISIPRAEPEA